MTDPLRAIATGSGEDGVVHICAPMVRYSRLAFRTLVRRHNVHVVFTPMFVSESFIASQRARDADFRTHTKDTPLVVQFAAATAEQFAAAAQIVEPYASAVDLNCGCPQRWAMQEGYGSALIQKPELISDMVRQTRMRCSSNFPVSVKVRLRDTDVESVELARQVEHAGASWLTVHGRTPAQRHQPVNLAALRLIKDAINIPMVANGDICSLADVRRVHEATGCDGVMAARGMLANPAMFDVEEHACTPLSVVREWVDTALGLGTPFPLFHHHLIFMLEGLFSRSGEWRFVVVVVLFGV